MYCLVRSFAAAQESNSSMNPRTKTLVRTFTLAFSAVALTSVAACNTVSGFGEDIEQTSDNTKKALGGTPNPAPGQTKQGDVQK